MKQALELKFRQNLDALGILLNTEGPDLVDNRSEGKFGDVEVDEQWSISMSEHLIELRDRLRQEVSWPTQLVRGYLAH